MGDIIDRACAREQDDRSMAIAYAARSTPTLAACGQCYNCLASLPDGLRFCDVDCRDDYQARKAAEVRRG